jgi:hypothetical protein
MTWKKEPWLLGLRVAGSASCHLLGVLQCVQSISTFSMGFINQYRRKLIPSALNEQHAQFYSIQQGLCH